MNSIEKAIDIAQRQQNIECDFNRRRVSDVVESGDILYFLSIEEGFHGNGSLGQVVEREIFLARYDPNDDGCYYLRAIYQDIFTRYAKFPELELVSEEALFSYAATVAKKVHGLDFARATTRKD